MASHSNPKALPPIVVTRPHAHAEELLEALRAMGLEARHHPLIDLQPFKDDGSTPAEAQQIRQLTLDIDRFRAVIAISQNAAECGLYWLDRYWPQFPIDIDWYAVGPTTAYVLEDAGLAVQQPLEQFDSEGVLALPGLQSDQIDGEKVLIWRGVGGRETLATELRKRGAEVVYCELYRRDQVDCSADDWQRTLAGKPLLLLSSGQALDIIEQQVGILSEQISGIIVPSERVAEKARAAGYRKVMVAASARNEDTLHSLRQWLIADDVGF
ncbi:MAG: uroporphyrinogen-III synthase [Oleibacter sp.]|nr:uroporphyrinogen-III synthase [Thalassolituus sp.]